MISGFYTPFNPSGLKMVLTMGTARIAEGLLERYCKGCNDWYPADSEFWYCSKYTGKYKTGKIGIITPCKSCRIEIANRAIT